MEEKAVFPVAAIIVRAAAGASLFCYSFLILVRHSCSEPPLDILVYSAAILLALLLFQFNLAPVPPLNFQNYYSTQYEFIVLLTVVANSHCCCPVKAVVSVANIGG